MKYSLIAVFLLFFVQACDSSKNSSPSRAIAEELGSGDIYYEIRPRQRPEFAAPETSLRPMLRPDDLVQCGEFCNDYPPRRAEFVSSNTPRPTYSATNSNWLALSASERATYIYQRYERILAAQNYPCNYSPRILTCKSYRESMHYPQWQTAISGSSAAGLAQVTRRTMRDMLERPGFRFNSVIPGFQNRRGFNDLWDAQKGNMLLQLDLSLGVMERKRIDNGLSCDSIEPFLRAYYGNPRAACNTDYSEQIYKCAVCIQGNGNRITESCLEESKAKVEGC